MPTLSQHRIFTLTLFLGTFLVLLARPITVLYRILESPTAMTKPSVRNVQPLNNKAVLVKELNGISLRAMTREYTSSISGKTLCDGKPCAATLKISIEPDGMERPVIKTIHSGREGVFQAQIHFQTLPNNQMDWRVTAVSEDLLIGDVHGRQILSDDSPIVVSQDIHLH